MKARMLPRVNMSPSLTSYGLQQDLSSNASMTDAKRKKMPEERLQRRPQRRSELRKRQRGRQRTRNERPTKKPRKLLKLSRSQTRR